jgi:hypothetical protein
MLTDVILSPTPVLSATNGKQSDEWLSRPLRIAETPEWPLACGGTAFAWDAIGWGRSFHVKRNIKGEEGQTGRVEDDEIILARGEQ